MEIIIEKKNYYRASASNWNDVEDSYSDDQPLIYQMFCSI